MVDKINKEEMAVNYGFALAFFQSNDELWHLFNQAINHTWTQGQFTARLRGTDWFKHHSVAVRNAILQEKADPASYQAAVNQMYATVRDSFGQLFGATAMSDKQMRGWAETAHRLGWTQAQLMDRMVKSMDLGKMLRTNTLSGSAAQASGQLDSLIEQFGVDLGDKWKATQIRRLMNGDDTIEGITQRVRQLAMREYKAFADELASGRSTVQDIADPYIQKMASLLEINPADINLKNKLIQKALKQRTPDGKPAAMDFTDFADLVRKDPRWQYTDNARQEMASVTATVGQLFGVVA